MHFATIMLYDNVQGPSLLQVMSILIMLWWVNSYHTTPFISHSIYIILNYFTGSAPSCSEGSDCGALLGLAVVFIILFLVCLVILIVLILHMWWQWKKTREEEESHTK